MRSLEEVSPSRRWFLLIWTAAIYLFLYLPMIVLCVYSFNAGRYSTIWEGFSLAWFAKLVENQRLLDAMANSLAIAALSTVLSVILGTLLGLYISRGHGGTRAKILYRTGYIPLLLPDLVLGVGFLILMARVLRPAAAAFGLDLGSLVPVALGHATVGMSYTMVLVLARLNALDPRLEESASNLGATPGVVIWRILIPQLYPVLASSSLIVFALSMDDFYLAYFTTAGGTGFQTLPLFIYALQARAGVSPELNAISTLMLAGSLILVGIAFMINMTKNVHFSVSSKLALEDMSRTA